MYLLKIKTKTDLSINAFPNFYEWYNTKLLSAWSNNIHFYSVLIESTNEALALLKY